MEPQSVSQSHNQVLALFRIVVASIRGRWQLIPREVICPRTAPLAPTVLPLKKALRNPLAPRDVQKRNLERNNFWLPGCANDTEGRGNIGIQRGAGIG